MYLCQVQIRLPTLALKPRGDVTIIPKQGYQWPHKKDSCPSKKTALFALPTYLLNLRLKYILDNIAVSLLSGFEMLIKLINSSDRYVLTDLSYMFSIFTSLTYFVD